MKTFAIRAVLFIVVLCSAAIAAEQRFTVPIENSPSLGPENARVTIFEFIDFQ